LLPFSLEGKSAVRFQQELGECRRSHGVDLADELTVVRSLEAALSASHGPFLDRFQLDDNTGVDVLPRHRANDTRVTRIVAHCTLCPAGFQASGSATLTLRLFQVSPSIRPTPPGSQFWTMSLLVGGAERHSREHLCSLETVRSIEHRYHTLKCPLTMRPILLARGSPRARVGPVSHPDKLARFKLHEKHMVRIAWDLIRR